MVGWMRDVGRDESAEANVLWNTKTMRRRDRSVCLFPRYIYLFAFSLSISSLLLFDVSTPFRY